MISFKDFSVNQVSQEELGEDTNLLPEGFVYNEEPLMEGKPSKPTTGDPPAVMVMRRMSIRQFPNGQKIALYKIDKLDRWITVPYSDDNYIMSTGNINTH